MAQVLAALLAWLETAMPFLYQYSLMFLGADWQRRVDEAKIEREMRKALQQEMEDTARANEQAHIVDEAFERRGYGDDDGALERLRDFWNNRTH